MHLFQVLCPRNIVALFENMPESLRQVAVTLIGDDPSLHKLAPLIFRNPKWTELRKRVLAWATEFANGLIVAYDKALMAWDPAEEWRRSIRGDDGDLDAKDLDNFRWCLVECGGDAVAVNTLDRVLYYAFRRALVIHIEEYLDPEHQFTAGSSFARWCL